MGKSEGNHYGELDVVGMSALRWILESQDGMLRTGLTSGGLL
jgi:hypothetical protein